MISVKTAVPNPFSFMSTPFSHKPPSIPKKLSHKSLFVNQNSITSFMCFYFNSFRYYQYYFLYEISNTLIKLSKFPNKRDE